MFHRNTSTIQLFEFSAPISLNSKEPSLWCSFDFFSSPNKYIFIFKRWKIQKVFFGVAFWEITKDKANVKVAITNFLLCYNRSHNSVFAREYWQFLTLHQCNEQKFNETSLNWRILKMICFLFRVCRCHFFSFRDVSQVNLFSKY